MGSHKIIKGNDDSTGLNAKLLLSFILLKQTKLPLNTQGEKKGSKCSEAELKVRFGFNRNAQDIKCFMVCVCLFVYV